MAGADFAQYLCRCHGVARTSELGVVVAPGALGRVVQVDPIKTRVKSVHGIIA